MANLKKAFVRIDGSGRTVPSSLIIRKSMPKVGRWAQVPYDKCCDPICNSYVAYGSVVAAVILRYEDCDGIIRTITLDSADPYSFCAKSYSINIPGTVEFVQAGCERPQ